MHLINELSTPEQAQSPQDWLVCETVKVARLCTSTFMPERNPGWNHKGIAGFPLYCATSLQHGSTFALVDVENVRCRILPLR